MVRRFWLDVLLYGLLLGTVIAATLLFLGLSWRIPFVQAACPPRASGSDGSGCSCPGRGSREA
jgi:hypothetical protein